MTIIIPPPPDLLVLLAVVGFIIWFVGAFSLLAAGKYAEWLERRAQQHAWRTSPEYYQRQEAERQCRERPTVRVRDGKFEHWDSVKGWVQ